MAGSAGSGHFAGLIIAVVALIGLLFWLTRPKTAARFGGRRWLFLVAALPVLIAFALFGNGSYHTYFRTSVSPLQGLPANVTQEHVDAALKTARSDEFIEYYAALEGKPAFRGADLAELFQARVVGPAELAQAGIQMSPQPAPNERHVLVVYREDANPIGVMLGMGKAERDARWEYVNTLAMDYLVELIALEALKVATTDAARIAILDRMVPTVPQTAEWIGRDLQRLKASGPLSPELAAAVEKKLAYVQIYINDPTKRALPASRKVTLR